jgi:hypothetical protein
MKQQRDISWLNIKILGMGLNVVLHPCTVHNVPFTKEAHKSKNNVWNKKIQAVDASEKKREKRPKPLIPRSRSLCLSCSLETMVALIHIR